LKFKNKYRTIPASAEEQSLKFSIQEQAFAIKVGLPGGSKQNFDCLAQLAKFLLNAFTNTGSWQLPVMRAQTITSLSIFNELAQ